MVPYFTGRQSECKEIIGHVTSETNRIVSIWGSPGFGKTSVAVAVGYDLQSQGFPVYWLSLRGLQSKDDLASKLLSLIKANEPIQSLPLDDQLCQHLSEISNHCVVILDNADDVLESGLPKVKEEVIELIEEILRRNRNVSFVLTTRESSNFMKLHFQGHKEVRIRPLDEASSQSLVHELLPNGSTSDCARIMQICGHVPLAIKLLCSSISEDDSVQPTQFLDDFVDSSTENIVEMLDNPDYPTNHRLNFLFDSSFQRLSTQEKETLVSLCFLPESIEIKVAAAVLGKTTFEARKILQSLRRKSLLDSSTNPGSFIMHKLIQSFAKENGEQQMKGTVLCSKARFYAFYVSLFEGLNEQFLTGHSMSAYIAFYEDKQLFVQSLFEGCSDSKTADVVFDVLVKAELFLDSLFWILSEAGNFNRIYDSALKAASRLRKTTYYRRLLVSRAFSEVIWGARGITMQFLSKVSEIQPAPPPVSSDEEAKHLCYLGIHYLTIGKAERGVQCLQEALSLMNNSAEQRIHRLLIFQILAVYFQFQSDSLTSTQFYAKALQESRAAGDVQLLVIPAMHAVENTTMKIDEQMNPDENANTLRNQPLQLQVIFHVKEASKRFSQIDTNKFLRKAMLKTLDEIEAALPNGAHGLFNFHRVVVSMLPFFRECEDTINIAEARICYHQTGHEQFKISRSKSGKEISASSSAIQNDVQGKSNLDFDDTQHGKVNTLEILQSRHRAVDIALKRFGEKHVSTADSYHELGIMEHALGDYSSALESKQHALNIRFKLFGEEHSSTADSYHELGATQQALGALPSALKSTQRALIIRRKLFGEQHLKTANSIRELAATQHKLGDTATALRSAQCALDIRLRLFGEDHLSAADSYHQLGDIQRSLGDYTSARE